MICSDVSSNVVGFPGTSENDSTDAWSGWVAGVKLFESTIGDVGDESRSDVSVS